MTLFDMPMYLSGFFDFLNEPMWRGWPFNAGYGDHILPAMARMAFVALIFGVIIVFLRFLYGPNGIFRDEELDREAAEIIKKERAELEAQYENGEINEYEYKIRMRSLKDQ